MNRYTEWFDGAKFQPHHHGLYEVEHQTLGWTYQYWDGDYWYALGFDRRMAEIYYFKRTVSYTQTPKFRGLKYDAKIHAGLTH